VPVLLDLIYPDTYHPNVFLLHKLLSDIYININESCLTAIGQIGTLILFPVRQFYIVFAAVATIGNVSEALNTQ